MGRSDVDPPDASTSQSTPKGDARLRSFRLLAAAASVVAALVVPSAAQAAGGYVVTLRNAADTTCHSAFLAVTMDFNLVPSQVDSSALCGFSAALPKAKAREMALDPRVQAVEPDWQVTLP